MKSRATDRYVTTSLACESFDAFAQIHSPTGAPISVRLFNDCHRLLMQGAPGASKHPVMLAEVGERKRDQLYCYDAYLRVLD